MAIKREQTDILLDVEEFINLEDTLLKEHIILLQEHFLFTALNSIKGAAILGLQGLPELLDAFTECLRYQFACIRCKDKISFVKECNYLKHYITIEKLRYRELSVEWDVEEADFFIPPMCIALLLSGSINQCMSAASKRVHLFGALQDKEYIFRLWNTVATEEKVQKNTIEQTRKMVARWWKVQSGANLSWSSQEDRIILTAHIPLVH